MKSVAVSSGALQQAQGLSPPVCPVGVDEIQGVTAERSHTGCGVYFLRGLAMVCPTVCPNTIYLVYRQQGSESESPFHAGQRQCVPSGAQVLGTQQGLPPGSNSLGRDT